MIASAQIFWIKAAVIHTQFLLRHPRLTTVSPKKKKTTVDALSPVPAHPSSPPWPSDPPPPLLLLLFPPAHTGSHSHPPSQSPQVRPGRGNKQKQIRSDPAAVWAVRSRGEAAEPGEREENGTPAELGPTLRPLGASRAPPIRFQVLSPRLPVPFSPLTQWAAAADDALSSLSALYSW